MRRWTMPMNWRSIRIGRVLTISAMLSMLPALAGCTNMTTMPEATATEREICVAWRDSLPTRSRADTAQTRAEIGLAYDVQAAACPSWARFPEK